MKRCALLAVLLACGCASFHARPSSSPAAAAATTRPKPPCPIPAAPAFPATPAALAAATATGGLIAYNKLLKADHAARVAHDHQVAQAKRACR